MFRLNDLILLLVVFSSMAVGILAPGPCAFFQPYPLYLMMFLLYLSFLSIRVETVLGTVRKIKITVLWLCAAKLVILPLILYFACRMIYPEYALAVLLLAGVSTGVVAPFIAGLLDADMPIVLAMVVLTSPLVPITLPVLVRFLPGQEFHVPFGPMFRMLVLTVFIPIAAVELSRRLLPKLTAALMKRRFPISLVIFALINFGVFSKYAVFFQQNPGTLLEATLVAIILALILLAAGILTTFRRTLPQQVGAAVSFGNMNNVLIIVFAAQFFGPLEPTLAAVYMIPFFGLILPLRAYRQIREKGAAYA